jgi:hypothetical protein
MQLDRLCTVVFGYDCIAEWNGNIVAGKIVDHCKCLDMYTLTDEYVDRLAEQSKCSYMSSALQNT